MPYQLLPIEPMAIAYAQTGEPAVVAMAVRSAAPTATPPSAPVPLATPKRRRWRRVVGVTAGILVMLVAASPSWAGMLESRPSAVRTVQPPNPTPTPTAVATKVGDRTGERGRDLQRQIDVVAAAQGRALLRHDEFGFLAPAHDPGAQAALHRRYRNLVAMQVSGLKLDAGVPTVDQQTGLWKVGLRYSFCFVRVDCAMDTVTETTVWRDAPAGPELLSLAAPARTTGWFGSAQPWQLSDLEVMVGRRALVATTAALKSRLPLILREAEKAAAVADTYATSTPPDIYRVYLAGGKEWRSWYGGVGVAWAAGIMMPIGLDRGDVMLNNSSAPNAFIADMLRHEMTHAATIHGSHYFAGNWWLIEGIAEVAEHPAGLTTATWSAETRRYIRTGWKRTLPADEPPAKASNGAVGALYGVAFLATKRLEVRHGRDKLLAFFDRVIEHGSSKDKASLAVFGIAWSEVEADCLKAIAAYR